MTMENFERRVLDDLRTIRKEVRELNHKQGEPEIHIELSKQEAEHATAHRLMIEAAERGY